MSYEGWPANPDDRAPVYRCECGARVKEKGMPCRACYDDEHGRDDRELDDPRHNTADEINRRGEW